MEHFALDHDAPAAAGTDRVACAAVIASIVFAACSVLAIVAQSEPPVQQASAMEVDHE